MTGSQLSSLALNSAHFLATEWDHISDTYRRLRQVGQTLQGQPTELPTAAPAMIARIGSVTHVQETGTVSGDVYRTPLIPAIDTNDLTITAASLGLPRTVGTSVAEGSYLNAATAESPSACSGGRGPAPGHRPRLLR